MCTSGDLPTSVLATLARFLCRDRWGAFLVTPATLLRWHRGPVARSWTYPNRGGPNALEQGVVDLVVRLARKNPQEADLRGVCDDLRRQQVSSVAGYVLDDHRSRGFSGLVRSLQSHARRALATPETEVSSDEWDLGVFGHSGSVSFARINQHWLRESAKRWAADDLPRRRLRPGRRTSVGLAVRHHVNCLALLSGSLRLQPDRGERPGALGRPDMEVFLNRLAYLASSGRISNDARTRAVREVRAVLTRARAMGLTRPGPGCRRSR